MTEAKFERAAAIAKKALALTNSIKTMEFSPPGDIVITMENKKTKEGRGSVQVYCEDAGNPADIVMRIHQMILEDLIEERDELKQEFKEL